MLANSGHEIGRELFGIVGWQISQGINVVGSETRGQGLRRVKCQFEPLISLLGVFDLKAPPVIFALIGDLSAQCKQNVPVLGSFIAPGTHVGTFSWETPSRLSEVASGHCIIMV